MGAGAHYLERQRRLSALPTRPFPRRRSAAEVELEVTLSQAIAGGGGGDRRGGAGQGTASQFRAPGSACARGAWSSANRALTNPPTLPKAGDTGVAPGGSPGAPSTGAPMALEMHGRERRREKQIKAERNRVGEKGGRNRERKTETYISKEKQDREIGY